MKAILDRVFIRPDEPKKRALIIEEKEETLSGVVISVGPEVKSIKEGEHVVYFKWDDLKAPNGLVVVRERNLLGVYDE